MGIKRVRKSADNRLTAMIQVRNEANRFLRMVLENLSGYVDSIVIVDDASTDDTVAICKSYSKVSNVLQLHESSFKNEWKLRSLLWDTACQTNPDWILAVDADEIYENKMLDQVHALINQDAYDWVSFRMFDFWGGLTHYREDHYWNIHKRHIMTLVRYLPGYYYHFPQMSHHAARLPISYNVLPGYSSTIRIKHLGWAGSAEERYQKYLRYLEHDPDGKWGSLEQYQSILDPAPHLVEWREDET